MSRITALALLPLVLAAPVLAQDEGDPYAACAGLADNAQRLTCFDNTYAARRATVAESERLAAEQAARDEARRADEFGLSYAEREQRRAAEASASQVAAADVERVEAAEAETRDFAITGVVAESFLDSRGKKVVLLENGQLWRETNSSSMNRRPNAGWRAIVSRHWSGAYEMRFEERSGYLRMTRIR